MEWVAREEMRHVEGRNSHLRTRKGDAGVEVSVEEVLTGRCRAEAHEESEKNENARRARRPATGAVEAIDRFTNDRVGGGRLSDQPNLSASFTPVGTVLKTQVQPPRLSSLPSVSPPPPGRN